MNNSQMKPSYYTILAIFVFVTFARAQNISKDALGLRLANSEGFGAEISYQHAFTEHNRLELNLGLSNGKKYDGLKLSALEEWVWKAIGNLNWYLGAGGGIASYNYDYNDLSGSNINDNYTFLFLAAIGGLEYNFNAPFVLSLDIRPELGLSDSNFRNDNFEFDIGIGLRYQF